MADKIPGKDTEARISQRAEAACRIDRLEDDIINRELDYCRMVENALTGICVDQDGRILYANEQFAVLFEVPHDEIIGMHSVDLIHPEDRARADEARRKMLQGEKTFLHEEIRGLTRNGRAIWLRRRSSAIIFRERPAILDNVVDITEQRRSAEEAAASHRELKDFIQAATHDLKAPLVAIQGLSQRLLEKFAGDLDPKVLGYVERIKSGADHIADIVSDLHTFSQAGEWVLNEEDVSVSEIVHGIRSTFHQDLKHKGIVMDIPENLPVLRTDRKWLHEVFQNLIENAVHYLDGGPHPSIRVGWEEEDGFSRFFVSDNGRGIAPEDQERIFEKFTRLSDTAESEGTGLGLAIVKRVVEKMGGRVWVESEKGQGATFYFTIPCTPEKHR